MGAETEDEDQVDRPIADDLVGDRGVAGLGVPGLRRGQRNPEPNRIPGLSGNGGSSGENSRAEDIDVNAIEFIREDESVEITPESIRPRKAAPTRVCWRGALVVWSGDPVRRWDQGRACDDERERDHPSGDRHRPGPDRVTEDQDAADDCDEVGRSEVSAMTSTPGPICRPRVEA